MAGAGRSGWQEMTLRELDRVSRHLVTERWDHTAFLAAHLRASMGGEAVHPHNLNPLRDDLPASLDDPELDFEASAPR